MPIAVREFLDKYKDICIIILLLALAAYLRPFPSLGVMGRDETSYAFLIKHFADGTFLDDYIFIAFHPLYSFIAFPIAIIGVDPELAGRIVSYSMGILSIVPTYLIGKILFSRFTASIAGFMTASFPVLIKWAGIVQAQTTFSFMLLMSMLFFVLFFKNKKYLHIAVSGVFLGLAYLSRAEGMGIFAGSVSLVLILCLCKKLETRKSLKGLLLFIFCFFIMVSPYMYALKSKAGEVKFTNKFYIAVRAAVIDTYKLDYEKLNYGKDNIGEYEVYKLALKSYPQKIVDFVKIAPEYFGTFSIIFAFLPLFLWIFSLLKLNEYLFFLPYLYVLLILPFFFVAENYFIPYAPFLFLLSGYGVDISEKYLKRFYKQTRMPIISFILFALIGYLNIFHVHVKNHFYPPESKFDLQAMIYKAYRDFGNEISANVEPNSKIMARYNMAAWYAGGEFVVFPDLDVDDFLSNIGKYAPDYIVIGPAEQGMRPLISNYINKAVVGVVIDKRFSLITKKYYSSYFEFTLVKVKAP